MATGGPAGGVELLSVEQIETLTDLMVSKLASVHLACREGYLNDDPHRLYRDEIRLVIVDTDILCRAPDPAALLDEWAASA